MWAAQQWAEVPWAGASGGLDEAIVAVPASPYIGNVGVAIVPITLTISDPDNDIVELSKVSGDLPPGITINRTLPDDEITPYTAVISGTPSATGSYSVTYQVDDRVDTVETLTLNFDIFGGDGIAVIGGLSFGFIRNKPGKSIR